MHQFWAHTGRNAHSSHDQEKFIDTNTLQPPSAFLLTLEPLRAVADYFAGLAIPVVPLPRGDGHPVIVFPGFGANGAATADLRGRLQQLGYQVYDWEQGVSQWPNTDFDQWLLRLGDHLEQIHARHGCAVSLIGWSLGGIYARELAKKLPKRVRQVVTLATPFADKPNATHAGWLAGMLSGTSTLMDGALMAQLSVDPAVPCASVYSQTDGIVAWRGCLGTASRRHRNIEVVGVSHMGMVHHPEVLRVIASLLAQR